MSYRIEAPFVHALTFVRPPSWPLKVIATILLAFALATPRVAAENARLELQTAGPTRVYLTDASGTRRTPPNALAYHKGREDYFIVPGRITVELPPGHYRVHSERGPEYRQVTIEFDLRAGERRQIELNPQRWIDMNARGWYSGDLHNHCKVEEIPSLLLAEDLNLAPTLVDWVWEDSQRSESPATNAPVRSVDARHAYSVLDKEVERLVEGPGAVDLLGLRSRIPFQGYRLYPPNTVFTEAAHQQGGYVDAEKIVWRDIPALVAFGQVDFAGIVYNHFNRQGVELETDSWGMIPKWRAEFQTKAGMPLWAMEVYYHFLNCGFRLPVSAGSASGVKEAPLGYNRVYVHLKEPFSYAAWFRALKSGRSFATNGPLLFLTVAGLEPGETVKARSGKNLRVRIEAKSLRALDRLEIIYRGRVVRRFQNFNPRGDFVGTFEFTPPTDGWLAARVFEKPGRTIRFAHTSPVYLHLATPSTAAEDAKFFLEWIDREMLFYRHSTAFRREADRAAMLDLFLRARGVYEAMTR
jgi:hypothetical protein